MDSEKTEIFAPNEILDSWKSMGMDEKIKIFTNPSPEMIIALTEFVKEFGKSGEKVAELRKDRNDALIEMIKKDNMTFDEKVKIIELIDKGIKEAEDAKDKDNNQRLKALAIAGGIFSIVVGGTVSARGDKEVGRAMMATGSAVLLGAVGSDTKIGKILITSILNLQDEKAVEV